MLLTIQKAQETELGKKIESVRPFTEDKEDERYNELYRGSFLAALFLQECKAKKENPAHDSQWLSYIDAIPFDSCKDYPVNFDEELLSEVNGCQKSKDEVK